LRYFTTVDEIVMIKKLLLNFAESLYNVHDICKLYDIYNCQNYFDMQVTICYNIL